MIGHNNPPAREAHALHIEDLFALVNDTLAGDAPITTDAQEAAISALLDDIRLARKAADTSRADEKRPHMDAGKAVDDAYKPLLARCDSAADWIKRAVTPFREARQRAKDEAARIAREAAELELERARLAMIKADDLGSLHEAEERREAAIKQEAKANRVDKTATGLVTYWEAELDKPVEAMRAYYAKDPAPWIALAQSLADRDARGTRAPVPGVIFHERKRAR